LKKAPVTPKLFVRLTPPDDEAMEHWTAVFAF